MTSVGMELLKKCLVRKGFPSGQPARTQKIAPFKTFEEAEESIMFSTHRIRPDFWLKTTIEMKKKFLEISIMSHKVTPEEYTIEHLFGPVKQLRYKHIGGMLSGYLRQYHGLSKNVVFKIMMTELGAIDPLREAPSPFMQELLRQDVMAGKRKQYSGFCGSYNDPTPVLAIAPDIFLKKEGEISVKNRTARLTKEQDMALAHERDRGNKAAWDALVQANIGIVKVIINRSFSSKKDRLFHEMHDAGTDALFRAAGKYGSMGEAKFTTYAWKCIYWAIFNMLVGNKEQLVLCENVDDSMAVKSYLKERYDDAGNGVSAVI
jgi:hypothetical protein